MRTTIRTGPKRLRRTRRELPLGQVRRWGLTVGNFKREREQGKNPWPPRVADVRDARSRDGYAEE